MEQEAFFEPSLTLTRCFAGISLGAAMTQSSEDSSVVALNQTSGYDLDTVDQTIDEKSLEISKSKKKKFKAYVWYSDHVGMRCKTKWTSSTWRHHVNLRPNECDNTRWSDHKIKSFVWNFYPSPSHYKDGELEKWGK